MSEGIQITVEGYEAEQVEEFIATEVRAQVANRVAAAVKEQVTERVGPAITEKIEAVTDEIIRERVNNELDICLEEGWRQTNQWGKACGDRISLKDRLSDLIGDGKGNNSDAHRMLTTAVEVAITNQVLPVLKKEAIRLKDELKARVDRLVKSSLADVVREAVGLEKPE